MTRKSLRLTGGTVFNASLGCLEPGDVFVTADGLISSNLEEPDSQELDCRGLLVVPGLIDLHVHVYHDATVLGVEPDLRCLQRGVTTVVDGGSAGAMTFPGLAR